MKFINLSIVLLFLSYSINSQDSSNISTLGQPDEVEITNAPPTTSDAGAPEVMSVMTSFELQLSLGVLVFGLIVMAIELYLMKVNKFDQHETIKFLLVTLIITSALFLIAAGYSNNQIAPAMGLLGTVAGYLLGKGETPTVNDTNKKP